MVNIHGIIPGKNVVVIGSGDIGLIMARRMTWRAQSPGGLEILDHLSGLVRNKIQCLDDFGIPFTRPRNLEIMGKTEWKGSDTGTMRQAKKRDGL